MVVLHLDLETPVVSVDNAWGFGAALLAMCQPQEVSRQSEEQGNRQT